MNRAKAGRKKIDLCACPKWVTGRLHFNLETDNADERPLALNILAPWPAKTAISERYVRQMEKRLPGAMEIQQSKKRLIIRVSNTSEVAYTIFGVCPCGNLLIERDGFTN